MLADTILQGMRIIEASAFVAAPLGGMTLAQLGAEVIRIDPLGGGLDHRRWPVAKDGTSLFWCGLNKAKKSVTIDIASDAGRELATALITAPGPDAGVLLTNFPARGFLDYETLRAHRTDLIQLTIMGDRHGRSAVDYTVNPRMGIPYLTGPASNVTAPPAACNHMLPAWDLIAGNLAATGILAAERTRRKTGAGQHVRLALEDTALAVMGHLGLIAEAQLGMSREALGNDLFGAFGRDFVSADGERVMIVALTGRQWKSLCEATGLSPAIAALERTRGVDLRREGERFKARADIASLIEPWIAARAFADIAAHFDAHGVCWSRYQTVQQLVRDDPECSTRNPLFTALAQPGVGELLAPGLPLAFSGFERAPAKSAPQLGEHTEQVLSEILGLNTAQLGALYERKVIGRAARADN
ncbi:mesaconyl-CoA C1-C4 CoA transferase [Paraburkholderia unamae]|uniref:CoA transferase n=1 Tax=Paraburkholderia unamae TaxID=219649 RepID=UPI000DC603CF|nr:CoA transferase [Paraburkholderia unamae]RAR56421.1 mesaconyl-CoA C1-C4 CoA transferase [Paraburkholderia unamae]